MSSSIRRFCTSLEKIVGLSAVAAEWRRELGAEWSWARHLLRATEQQADCFPKLEGDPKSSSAYRIVWRDDAADLYVGSCPDRTGTIKLRGADIQVYELDRQGLAERVASAMGLVSDFALLADPHACRVGAFSRLGLNQAWVYLGIPPGPSELGVALASLAAGHREPLIVLTIGSGWRGGHQILQNDVAVVALEEVLEVDDVGVFRATPAVGRMFDRLCPQAGEVQANAVFRRHGEGYLVVYENQTTILQEMKGCEYIGFLLAHPGVSHHAAEVLVAAAHAEELAKLARERGDAVLDAATWKELRQRSRELLEEMADARRLGDKAAQKRAEAELSAIAAELERATGKDGRGRRLKNASDAARKSVCNAIDRTLQKVQDLHEPLWRHLDATIRRGTRIKYDPPTFIDWQL